MSAIDISRLTDGVVLDPVVSNAIQAAALEASVFQRLATKVEMPAAGVTFQTITGEPEAQWVNETDEKPVSRPTFGTDFVEPYKMAVIVPFSDEFKRDAARLFAEVQRRIPNALARLFDRTVLGLETAPGAYFDQLSAATAVEFVGSSAEAAYQSLVDVEEAVSDGGGFNNGYALSPAARVTLMRVSDGAGNPTLTLGPDGGSLLGTRAVFSKHVAEVTDLMGVAGDWSQATWGTVEGVRLSASGESTLSETIPNPAYVDEETTPYESPTVVRTLNLWQRNMFALRAEVEVAFKANKDAFARLVDEA